MSLHRRLFLARFLELVHPSLVHPSFVKLQLDALENLSGFPLVPLKPNRRQHEDEKHRDHDQDIHHYGLSKVN
ncbi:MAG: hypothetical protein ABIT09_10850 [Croceibacterium sp.]